MIITISIAVLGGVSTFIIHKSERISAVKSSALCTFLFVLATILLNKQILQFDTIYYQSLFFGSTFVGMSSSEKLNFLMIGISSALFGFFFKLSHLHFNGIGGALGCSASIMVIIVYLLNHLREKIKS